MRDPSPSSVLVTLTPLTVTPLVESRSSMDKPMSLPWGQTLIRAWRREIPGSLMRMSASDPRPIVSPGGVRDGAPRRLPARAVHADLRRPLRGFPGEDGELTHWKGVV